MGAARRAHALRSRVRSHRAPHRDDRPLRRHRGPADRLLRVVHLAAPREPEGDRRDARRQADGDLPHDRVLLRLPHLRDGRHDLLGRQRLQRVPGDRVGLLPEHDTADERDDPVSDRDRSRLALVSHRHLRRQLHADRGPCDEDRSPSWCAVSPTERSERCWLERRRRSTRAWRSYRPARASRESARSGGRASPRASLGCARSPRRRPATAPKTPGARSAHRHAPG